MKKICFVFLMTLAICLGTIIASSLDGAVTIDAGTYIAHVNIDQDAELTEFGGVTVPFYFTVGHYADTGSIYGAMVRTWFSTVKNNGNEKGFHLEHLAITRGKVKGTKKLIFRLVKGDTIVFRKLRAKIKEKGDLLLLTMKNKLGKKFILEFKKIDTSIGGVFFGTLTDVANQVDGAIPVRNSVAGIQYLENNSNQDDLGRFSIVTYKKEGNTSIRSSWEGDLFYDDVGKFYHGNEGPQQFKYVKKRTRGEFNYQSGLIDREGILNNMGGNGKAPKLVNRVRVSRKKNLLTLKFTDLKNIDSGYRAIVEPVGNSKAWIVKTDYSRNDGFATVEVELEDGFAGDLNVTITNPDGTSTTTVISP